MFFVLESCIWNFSKFPQLSTAPTCGIFTLCEICCRMITLIKLAPDESALLTIGLQSHNYTCFLCWKVVFETFLNFHNYPLHLLAESSHCVKFVTEWLHEAAFCWQCQSKLFSVQLDRHQRGNAAKQERMT